MKKITRTAAWLVLLSLALPSCALLPGEDDQRAPPIITPEEIEYKTETVIKGDILQTVRTGATVMSVMQYNLSLKGMRAVLVEYNAVAGERVSAGDVLAVFESEDLNKQLVEQRRATELARMNYDNAARQKGNAIAYYEELQITAKIDVRIAEDDFAAAQGRYKDGEITESEYLKAQSAYRNSVAQIGQRLTQAKDNAESTADRRAQIELEAVEARLGALEEQYENFTIYAPIDGILTYVRFMMIGDSVPPNETLIYIADDSKYYIVVTGSAVRDFLPGMEVQVEASVRLEGMRETLMFEGYVVSSSEAVREAIGISETAALIETPYWPKDVGLGTSVYVRLVKDSRHDVVIVPVNAVEKYGLSYSYVRVLEDGVCRERPVKTGISTATEIEIISGLEPGEEIVVK